MDRPPPVRGPDTRATPKEVLVAAWRNRHPLVHSEGTEFSNLQPLTEAQAPLQKAWEEEINQSAPALLFVCTLSFRAVTCLPALLRDTLQDLKKLATELDEDQWRYENVNF